MTKQGDMVKPTDLLAEQIQNLDHQIGLMQEMENEVKRKRKKTYERRNLYRRMHTAARKEDYKLVSALYQELKYAG